MATTLRPRHLSSQFYFSTALISPLQASEQATANAIPMAHGLRMALRSSGTMIWWRRCSTHGERAKSRWVAAARVGYYCVSVFVGCRKIAEWRGMARNGGMGEWRNGYRTYQMYLIYLRYTPTTVLILTYCTVLILKFCTWYKSYWGGHVEIPPFNGESK